MKFKTGIKSQPNINKAIKNLESRELIKAVKSVAVQLLFPTLMYHRGRISAHFLSSV